MEMLRSVEDRLCLHSSGSLEQYRSRLLYSHWASFRWNLCCSHSHLLHSRRADVHLLAQECLDDTRIIIYFSFSNSSSTMTTRLGSDSACGMCMPLATRHKIWRRQALETHEICGRRRDHSRWSPFLRGETKQYHTLVLTDLATDLPMT